MINNRIKWIAIVFLSLCLGGTLILGCVSTINMFRKMSEDSSQAPVRSLRIILHGNQRDELFDQFRIFAEKHNFEYEITDFDRQDENFQYWMSRDDITIIASNPFKPEEFRIRFYRKYPGYPIDEKTIDDLLNELRSLISEIPNVTIFEDE